SPVGRPRPDWLRQGAPRGTGMIAPEASFGDYPLIPAVPSIGVTVRGRLAVVDGVRSASGWPSRHGTIAHHIVSPRGNKILVPKRYRAVPLLDNGVENVIRLAIEHDGWVGIQLNVDFVKLLFSDTDQRG